MITEQKPINSRFGETSTATEVISGISLNGKTVIVTGGHSGIGLETTKVLSGAGATVVVGSRDISKSKHILAEVNRVSVIELDLSEPLSVDAFANEFRKSFKEC